MPLFSVVVVDFDGSVPRDRARRGLASLANQTCRNFEVIVLHDGPRLHGPCADLVQGLNFPLLRSTQTNQRVGDWGHTLRDLGMSLATGDYIVHFNIDNLLYPEALETLAREVEHPLEITTQVIDDTNPQPRTVHLADPEILLFPILMRGMVIVNGRLIRFPDREDDLSIVLSGLPPVCQRIDCMQLVARREVWRRIGGWYDKSEDSDWKIYDRLLSDTSPRYVSRILGEHW